MDFYNLTGISFQSRELLFDSLRNERLILSEYHEGSVIKYDYIDNLDEESKKLRKENDHKYSILSKKNNDSLSKSKIILY